MRKVMLVFFSLLAISMMTMPAYAQGGAAAAPAPTGSQSPRALALRSLPDWLLSARARWGRLPAKAWRAILLPVLEFSWR